MKATRSGPILLAAAISGALWLQPAAAEAPAASPVFDLGEVLVLGGAREPATEGTAPRVEGERIRQRERQDVADAAALLPEVAIGRSGQRNEKMIMVRGFDMRQVPLFIDGIPVYVPYDGTVDPGRFGTFDVAEVSVARGFSPVVYGPNTLGGAINVVTLRPTRPRELLLRAGAFSGGGIEGGLRGGLLQPGGYLQGGLSYRERDTYRVAGDYTPAAAEDGGRRENSDSRDLQLNLKAAWTPAGGDELAVGFVRQDSEKGVPPYGGTNPRTPTRFWRYPTWEKNSLYFIGQKALGLNGYLKPRLYYDTYKNTLESFDDATYSAQTRPYAFTSFYDDYTFGGSVEAGMEVGERRAPRAAAHYKQDVHREHNAGKPESEFSDETMAVSIEDSVRFRTAWTLALGAGYERRDNLKAEDRSGPQPQTFPDNSNEIFNPQAGLFYAVTGGTFRATVAGKSRFPTLKDRYSYRRGLAIPNPDLDPEKAAHYEIGYAGKVGPALDGRLSLFVSRLRDAIQQVDNVQYDEPADTWLYQFQNVGKAEHKGLEVGLAWPASETWKAGVDYALLDRKNVSSPDLKPTDTPEHRVLAYVELRPTARLTLVPNVEYNSSRYSSSDGVKVDGFWLCHLNAKLKLPRGFAVAAGAQNVFDENYELTEGYPEEGRHYYANVSYLF
ncbi:MAG: TonB-dependent receptor [Verrucomicrobia bacterium]|nr:TonB-dependent receptor [Verrucomicrobiota bacterium]